MCSPIRSRPSVSQIVNKIVSDFSFDLTLRCRSKALRQIQKRRGRLFARLVAPLALLILGAPAASQDVAAGDHVRQSEYVAVRDGTRLAVNIYRPARDGTAIAVPLPVVFAFTP